MAMPCFFRVWRRRLEMSWSQPAAICGSISKTVTSAPAAAKKLANSRPM